MADKKTIAALIIFLIIWPIIFIGASVFPFPVQVDVVSKQVDQPLPITDPDSSLWAKALSKEIPLGAQTVTKPILATPSISTITINSLHNGSWIAFKLEWKDQSRDVSTVGTENYQDAAALQFPILEGKPFLGMGEEGDPVNIWQWRGDWQEDINDVYQEVEDTYPNMWVDFYPFSISEPPYIIPLLETIDNVAVPGWAAENPLSQPIKVTPISDLIAEGFGTLTFKPDQKVIGRGVWENGVWKVVYARPLDTGDPSDPQFIVGEEKSMAIAVWNGENREVDGRKAISAWLTMKLEGSSFLPFSISIDDAFATVAFVGTAAFLLQKPTRYVK
jgi:DMSO reductase family type II enzyme heme b subunit